MNDLSDHHLMKMISLGWKALIKLFASRTEADASTDAELVLVVSLQVA
jgi:hypothetical protein